MLFAYLYFNQVNLHWIVEGDATFNCVWYNQYYHVFTLYQMAVKALCVSLLLGDRSYTRTHITISCSSSISKTSEADRHCLLQMHLQVFPVSTVFQSCAFSYLPACLPARIQNRALILMQLWTAASCSGSECTMWIWYPSRLGANPWPRHHKHAS